MSAKQEIVSDAPSKARPFSSNFNFPCKNGRATTATCKYYTQLVGNPPITNCFDELCLKCGRIASLSFKTSPSTKTSPVLCEN